MRERDMVYAGWSAGACVAGTALQPISLMDDPSVNALGYEPSEPIMEGLGLIEGAIIPHFESNHPESEAAATAVQWSIEHGIKHLALRDGDVLVQDRDYASVLPRAVPCDVTRETRN
jgi:dipeptidase E